MGVSLGFNGRYFENKGLTIIDCDELKEEVLFNESENKIFAHLLSNQGRTVSRDILSQVGWSYPINNNAVPIAISSIRRKLKPLGKNIIITSHSRKGYQLLVVSSKSLMNENESKENALASVTMEELETIVETSSKRAIDELIKPLVPIIVLLVIAMIGVTFAFHWLLMRF